ncbi:MAG TPA: hypothetical protein VKZ65_08020 [Glycomyces sp.]|nr:hypothetical protein [Glycomyces sp.]
MQVFPVLLAVQMDFVGDDMRDPDELQAVDDLAFRDQLVDVLVRGDPAARDLHIGAVQP